MRRPCSVLFVLLVLFASTNARAGLRPRYGGELVILTPAAPVELDPARAWSAVEVALAASLGAPVNAFLDGPTEPLPQNAVRLKLSPFARWPDGRPVDASNLMRAFQTAVARTRVALPPLRFEVEKQALVVSAPEGSPSVRELLELPWLRLVSEGRGGAFRLRRGLLEADPAACGGAPLADSLRIEIYETRDVSAPDGGVVIGRPGPSGRPVLAVPRMTGDAQQALRAALAELDRASLTRLFVRTPAQPSTQKRDSVPHPAERPNAPVILSLDASERPLLPVAQRLQVLLRDVGLLVRIVAEPRETHFARLARQEYDLALVALPPGPEEIQAATVLRLFGPPGAADAFWQTTPTGSPLVSAFSTTGATHLYTEGGGIELGIRLRGANTTTPWSVDLSNAWLSIDSGRP